MGEDINPGQRLAIDHRDGPMMVIAGPGSGKTFVITRRIKKLIESGIPPEEILVITFTKAAALGMQSRFRELMSDEASSVTFGTFHAIYYHIIKQSYHFGQDSIITAKEKKQYMKTVLSSYPKVEDDDSTIQYLLAEFSRMKNEGVTVREQRSTYNLIDSSDFEGIYREYEDMLREARKLDFDDMVLLCRDLFISRPDVLEIWRDRFKYILIDEFQDINPMQYEVVKMLAAPLNNLFIVGDDDQSIYGFRGSCPTIMLGFPGEFPECRKVCLKNNYRSTKGIVDDACRLIAHNKSRFEKKLEAGKFGTDDVIHLEFANAEEEARAVTELVMGAAEHMKLSETAVIVRTNRSVSEYASVFAKKRIPFRMREKTASIFASETARDILAVLAFAEGDHSRENFLRFMNKPVRYIRRADLGARGRVELSALLSDPYLKPYVKRNVKALQYDLCRMAGMLPLQAVNYFRKAMGYEAYCVTEGRKRGKTRDEVLAELDTIMRSAAGMESFKQWLENIEDYEAELSHISSEEEDKDGVWLITMHASKGLEYNTVILPDLIEGNVPQKQAGRPEEIEEERRVFYVAMTRAKEKLILCSLKREPGSKITPSRFLKEF